MKTRSSHYIKYKKEYNHAYYLAHKEKLDQYNKIYSSAHPEYNRIRNYKYWKRIRLTVLSHYGNRCTCCGETTLEFLCIDHINNDGKEHRKQVGGSIYNWLIKNNYPGGFQILCHNCNMSKAFYGECPHETARNPQDSIY